MKGKEGYPRLLMRGIGFLFRVKVCVRDDVLHASLKRVQAVRHKVSPFFETLR